MDAMERIKEDHIYDAVREQISHNVIGVVDESCGQWGSGVPLKIDNSYLVLTAGHVIQDVKTENISFLWRGSKKLIKTTRDEIISGRQRESMEPTLKIPIQKTKIINPSAEDIGLILLNADECINRGLHFASEEHLQRETPIEKELVALSGFAREIATTGKFKNMVHVKLHLYTVYPRMITNPGGVPNFDPSIHFLLHYPAEELRLGESLVGDIKGMSGCGVWEVQKKKETSVWAIDTKLIGMQTSITEQRRIFKCTRIEEIKKAISDFL